MSEKIEEVIISQNYGESLKINLENDIFNPIDVKLQNNIENPINVNIDPRSPLSIVSLPKLKVELLNEKKEEYYYNISKELWITSKGLLSLWLIWILYSKFNITISQFINIKIIWDKNEILWFLGLIIISQILILIIYFYRDITKFKIEKTEQDIWNLKDLEEINYRINQMLDSNRTTTDEIEKVYWDKLEIIQHNQNIQLQIFQKNIVFLILQVSIPLFIGYLAIKSIWISPLYSILKNFHFIDLLLLISITAVILLITNKYLKSHIDLRKKENS